MTDATNADTGATSSAAVWANVCSLMRDAGHGASPSLDTVHKAIKGKVGRGQLQRLADGGNVTIKTIDALAAALRVPTWRLLQPQVLQARDPGGTYTIANNGALVSAIAELLARLPADRRTPAADLLAAWARSGVDDGRSDALLRLLNDKQQRAA